MNKFQKVSLFALRVTLGWMFFYVGITQVLDPVWSAAGYMKGAKNFVWLFQFFSRPDVLPAIDLINKWGLTLLGVSLILGIAVRLSSKLGVILMLLYYVALPFPYPNARALIVDVHIIYAAALMFMIAVKGGRAWGLDAVCGRWPLCSKYPKIHNFLS